MPVAVVKMQKEAFYQDLELVQFDLGLGIWEFAKNQEFFI